MIGRWLAGAALLCGGAAVAAPITIHAGRLMAVPGEAVRGPSTIVVDNGRIVSVTAGFQPAAGQLIDLKDKIVLPGLIDAHVHLATDRAGIEGLGAELTDSVPTHAYEAQWNGMKTLRAGFTTVRNLGDDGGKTLALRDAVARGWVQGPRIVDAGSPISTTGGHMDPRVGLNDHAELLFGKDNLCDGADDCRRAVRRQLSRGADVIKIATTGGVNSGTGLLTRMEQDEAAALIRTAHAYGKKVAVHAHGRDGVKLALRNGADSIEHGTDMDEEAVRLFKAAGTCYVPTLSTVNGYLERLAKDPNAYPPQARPQRRRVRVDGEARDAGGAGDQGGDGQQCGTARPVERDRHDRDGQERRYHRGGRRPAGGRPRAQERRVRHGPRRGGQPPLNG